MWIIIVISVVNVKIFIVRLENNFCYLINVRLLVVIKNYVMKIEYVKIIVVVVWSEM